MTITTTINHRNDNDVDIDIDAATANAVMLRTGDAKIDRIAASWLSSDLASAEWLASAADEVVVGAGTRVGGGRFAYILLDAESGCRLVAAGVAPVVVDQPTRVLVLAASALRDAVERFPVLTDAWAAGLARCPAAA